jgi:hypothetical protein
MVMIATFVKNIDAFTVDYSRRDIGNFSSCMMNHASEIAHVLNYYLTCKSGSIYVPRHTFSITAPLSVVGAICCTKKSEIRGWMMAAVGCESRDI